LRRQERLKLPDAIVAATAIAFGAEVLTNDKKLGRITGLRCRALALKGPLPAESKENL
jgi:predicted nucleic acid-binding protein